MLHRGQGLGIVELALEEAAVHERLHPAVQGQEQRPGAQGGQHDAPDALGAREQHQDRARGGGLGEEGDEQDARDRGVDHRLADDDVDVHQPVLEDADGERDGDQHVERLDDQVAQVHVPARGAEGEQRGDVERQPDQEGAGQRHDGPPERPAELALLLGVGLPVTGHQGDAGQERIEEGDRDHPQDHNPDEEEAETDGHGVGQADPRQQPQAAHRHRHVEQAGQRPRQPRMPHPPGDPAVGVEPAAEADRPREARAEQHQAVKRGEAIHPMVEQPFQQDDAESGQEQHRDQGDGEHVDPGAQLGPPLHQAKGFGKNQRQMQQARGKHVGGQGDEGQAERIGGDRQKPEADGRQLRLEDDGDQHVADAGGHGEDEEQAGPEIVAPAGEDQKADGQESRRDQQVRDHREPGMEAGQGLRQAQLHHPIFPARLDGIADGVARAEAAVQLGEPLHVFDGDAIDGGHALAGAEPRQIGGGTGQDPRDLARRRDQQGQQPRRFLVRPGGSALHEQTGGEALVDRGQVPDDERRRDGHDSDGGSEIDGPNERQLHVDGSDTAAAGWCFRF